MSDWKLIAFIYIYTLYLINCYPQHDADQDLFNVRGRNKGDKPTGKALEDICNCEAVEIVTTKVCNIESYTIQPFISNRT